MAIIVGSVLLPMYDVIGIQSHMHGGAWGNRQIWQTCERFARFGVPLHFTETTIISGNRNWEKPAGESWDSTPEGEAYQAENVVRFYTMLFSHPTVQAVTWWDFADLNAWQNAPAGFLRKDMTPKPAYEALLKLIRGKWLTATTMETGSGGEAAFRGFLGDYSVSVEVDGKTTAAGQYKLIQGKENRWVISLK